MGKAQKTKGNHSAFFDKKPAVGVTDASSMTVKRHTNDAFLCSKAVIAWNHFRDDLV
jgi:hypothetical protein